MTPIDTGICIYGFILRLFYDAVFCVARLDHLFLIFLHTCAYITIAARDVNKKSLE